jgi:hypothetical protein
VSEAGDEVPADKEDPIAPDQAIDSAEQGANAE